MALTGLDGRRSLALGHDVAGRGGIPTRRSWARAAAGVGAYCRPDSGRRFAGSCTRPRPIRSPGTYDASRSCDRGSSAVDEARRPAVRAVLDRFEQRVTPELAAVRAQVVHNDLAPTNVLVDDTLAVTGITDFGDMTHTALVCDLGVAAADVLSGRDDALEVAHEVRVGVRRRHTAGAAGGRTPRRPDGRALRRVHRDHRLADPAARLRAADRRRGVPTSSRPCSTSAWTR